MSDPPATKKQKVASKDERIRHLELNYQSVVQEREALRAELIEKSADLEESRQITQSVLLNRGHVSLWRDLPEVARKDKTLALKMLGNTQAMLYWRIHWNDIPESIRSDRDVYLATIQVTENSCLNLTWATVPNNLYDDREICLEAFQTRLCSLGRLAALAQRLGNDASYSRTMPHRA